MYADRYAPRRVNRGSLTLSVAIVGTLVAAAMVSRTTVGVKLIDRTLPTYWVKPTPPPPPEPLPRPEPQVKAKPAPRIDQPIPQVPTETPKAPYVAPPGPPVPGYAGTGDEPGTGAVVVEPVKPPPVVTGTEIDQRYARDFQPLYPPAEQRAGRDGVVTLKVLVGVDGRVVRAEQLMATSDEFWRVTLKQALARWRFKPATRDGIPFESWRTMTVRFRLADQ